MNLICFDVHVRMNPKKRNESKNWITRSPLNTNSVELSKNDCIQFRQSLFLSKLFTKFIFRRFSKTTAWKERFREIRDFVPISNFRNLLWISSYFLLVICKFNYITYVYYVYTYVCYFHILSFSFGICQNSELK